MTSPKELSMNQKIVSLTKEIIELTSEKDDLPLKVVQLLIDDAEVQAIQDYANTVSIVRLGFNDHGPVHMRTVCRNALKMLKIFYQAKIQTSLEKEQSGTFADSVTAVILASFFHDFGMTVGRQDHELYSAIIGQPIINSILKKVLPEEKDFWIPLTGKAKILVLRRRVKRMLVSSQITLPGAESARSLSACIPVKK